MKREVDYTWRLAELMAAHGMHNSTDLIPRLAERGVQLSRPQVYRIVHQRPNASPCSSWQHYATSWAAASKIL
ncbi:hypothetical protein MKCMC460_61610 (plasmid) [Mycobacterium sp. 20KCMC460]|nr:hypothetical protein MKCMC460_61610 [Mycobacterium sp. 20KCMC460]